MHDRHTNMKRRKVTAFSPPFKKTNTNDEMMNDRDGNVDCDVTQTVGFTIGRGQRISPPSENMDKARKLLEHVGNRMMILILMYLFRRKMVHLRQIRKVSWKTGVDIQKNDRTQHPLLQ